ncbi:MetQ/NlpA family ABC transporter substrate-binding protein [Candidatus Phytoplasma mali]|nr:MetQ/NlpA family ABC transporter substrate-binding protein [Candidatus Phytoplasma mali]
MNKYFKKFFFSFILFLILILAGFFSYKLFKNDNTNHNQNDQKELQKHTKLKVATALTPVEKFLNESCKEFLKKHNIDLEVQLLRGSFFETVNLVDNGQIDAVISCHTPWLLIEQNKKQTLNNIVPVQPFYIAKFGIYKHKNINLNIDNNFKNFKVLIPDDDSNRTFALNLFKKYGLVELKDNNKKNQPLSFILSLDDLHQNSKLKEDNFECKPLAQIEQAFQERISNEYKYNLAVNFPSFMSNVDVDYEKIDNNNFPNVIPNDNFLLQEKEFNFFAITLMSRENNKNNEEIKYLKESLKQDEIINFGEQNLQKTHIMIDSQEKIKNIMDNIEELFINNHLRKS